MSQPDPRAEARAIEWDCGQVLIAFFNAFDQWRYGDMAALFAPDGVWHRQGKALHGRDAILDVLHARTREQTVRHVVTNLQVTVTDATHADCLLYLTAYIAPTAQSPAEIAAPSLLLDVPGTLVLTDEGWRIASLSMNRVFVFK